MIDMRRLRALRELADAGSFSGAARTLGYTQSAISQHIAALERETGLQLVERGKRPVALTDAGRTVLTTAEPIFGHLARTDAAIKELAGLRADRIQVAGFPTACATFLPPAIAAVREQHPNVDVTLVEAEPLDAVRALKRGLIDLAVGYAYPALGARSDQVLQHTALFDDRFRLVLPRGHRLLSSPTVTLSDLAAESWVVPPTSGPSSDYRAMLAVVCRAVGFAPRIAFEIEDIRAGQALVAEKLGIALIPELALDQTHPGVETRDLTPEAPRRQIVATRLAGPEPIAASKTMLRSLEQIVRSFRTGRRKAGEPQHP